ncbi:flagellar motor protein MotB [Telmatospirillum sp. J64-1]|uniref:flagellar motor protein MotB n=1 Tax=Telmatospirillum sp. J64-1 TaxID=2502183 RepID=UPI00115EE34C|nr:flagellar motor protein MotB [Telmatospirillum sp. J64-1]
MADSNQPIIIKRIKKGGHGHHGGAWKVAYADFVTAMMAFFLLLWLLNAVTEEQLKGISDYFAPASLSRSSSGAGGMLGGMTIGEGAMTSQLSSPAIRHSLPPPTIGSGGEDLTDPSEGLTQEEFEEAMAEREQQQFERAMQALEQAMQSIPELAKLKDSLMVDNTPEGLRIQIVDQEGLAMFPRGSANMYGHTRALLELVSRVVQQLPKQIAISGHTDATRFADGSGYTNWELSADRALASRRVLMMAGVPEERIDRVVGRADQDPLVADDPSDARNRRISIVLLREQPVPGVLRVESR